MIKTRSIFADSKKEPKNINYKYHGVREGLQNSVLGSINTRRMK
jgi:hypothetical protein